MICTVDGCTEHYACEMRAKGVAVSPSATPNRTANRRQAMRPVVAPSWEKGTVGEKRPDGSTMPYLGSDGEPISVKAWGENRQGFEQQVKRLKSDPHVFKNERAKATA
jgi:hypothetical protein